MLNKFGIGFLGLLVFFQADVFAEVKFRKAFMKDVDQILAIQSEFSEQDCHLLFLMPEKFGLRRNSIERAIEKGRISVAEDIPSHLGGHAESAQIVSYIKTFLVTDKEEAKEILSDELKCVGSDSRVRMSYRFPMESDSQLLNSIEVQPLACSEGHLDFTPQRQAYIYYGSAYTRESYRGKGYGMSLLAYSLDALRPELVSQLKTHEISEMVFLFGQVEDNLRRKGRNDMIVRFSRFAGEVSQEAGLSPIQATRLGYEACKPEMVCDEKDGQPQISVTFPEKNKGMGSAVIYQVR